MCFYKLGNKINLRMYNYYINNPKFVHLYAHRGTEAGTYLPITLTIKNKQPNFFSNQ